MLLCRPLLLLVICEVAHTNMLTLDMIVMKAILPAPLAIDFMNQQVRQSSSVDANKRL